MDQCYYNGNFYQAKAAVSAGQSPATNPDLWSLVQIPARWRWILSKLTYANLLELDGQKDKANDEHDRAVGDERNGLDRLLRLEANKDIFRERPSVRGRSYV